MADAEALAAGQVFALPQALLAPGVTTFPGSAYFGLVQPGATTTVQLGAVRVVNGGARNWIATVSATDFTTGSGTPTETISKARLSYWSGPFLTKTGPGTNTPGQPTQANAEPLDAQRVAFHYSGSTVSASVTYQPRLLMEVPATAVAGTYTGTLTHSVA